MSIFIGNATAMVTPFNDRGIDFDAFSQHIEFQINNDTAALVVAGTTGEPATMTEAEKKALLKFTVKQVDKRVPIIFGTGCNDTRATIENSIWAEDLGADALLLVTPYYNKTTQDGLVAHFTAVADQVNIPVITYNVPSRTSLNVEAATLARYATHPNIAAHKESGGSIRQVMDMVRFCADDVDIYSGDDKMTFPLLACGGKGSIGVVSNITPRKCAKLVDSYMAGDIAGARTLQYQLDDLINALFNQVSPIPVKAAMNLMGMNAGQLRMPLVPLVGDDLIRLEQVLKSMELV